MSCSSKRKMEVGSCSRTLVSSTKSLDSPLLPAVLAARTGAPLVLPDLPPEEGLASALRVVAAPAGCALPVSCLRAFVADRVAVLLAGVVAVPAASVDAASVL